METNVDMNYRFTQDNEPADEQLLVIMKEVAEDVRREREKVAEQVLANIEREIVRTRSFIQSQVMQ